MYENFNTIAKRSEQLYSVIYFTTKSVKANLNIALSYYMIEKCNKNCYAKRMEANYASLNESVGFSVEELDKLLDLAMI